MTLLRRPLVDLRSVLVFAGLVLGWCGLWREFSFANLVGGTALAAVVLSLNATAPTSGGLRAVPLLRLIGIVAIDLVKSTVGVAAAILSPNNKTREAIIKVTTPRNCRHHLLLLVIAITVTPGTAVVDVDADNGTLYLHLLRFDQAPAVREHVAQLAKLADQALPISDVRRLGATNT